MSAREVFVLWVLPKPDRELLRTVIDDVRRREAERRARRSAGSAGF